MSAPRRAGDERQRSDETLVEKLRGGEHSAFDELYRRYFEPIYRFVGRRLSNRADVEETVQEIFVNVFASIGGWRAEAPFGAWIFGVARRTVASRFKKKRHPTMSIQQRDDDGAYFEAVARISVAPSQIEAYECHEWIDSIDRRMHDQLSEEQRYLFELHHLQDRSIQEIADALGKSADSVKSNLYRTRRILLSR